MISRRHRAHLCGVELGVGRGEEAMGATAPYQWNRRRRRCPPPPCASQATPSPSPFMSARYGASCPSGYDNGRMGHDQRV